MSLFDNMPEPLLTKQDEEYLMLSEVSAEYARQNSFDTPQNKSGKATETIIRCHLLSRGFYITKKPNVRLRGSDIKNDLLLLKPKVNPNLTDYSDNNVLVVIEVKNNAVGNQSVTIKKNFDELTGLFPSLQCVVIILSERKGYTHEITNEKLRNYQCFTFISRRQYPKVGGLYSKIAIEDLLTKKQMKKTGEWSSFLTYLSDR